jgi:hypothetical protein
VHEPSLPEAMTSADLVKELTSNASLLLQRQIKMAKLEAEQELHKRKTLYELMGIAGLLAFGGTIMLLLAAACGIGTLLGGRTWAGAVIIGAALLVAALVPGLLGWRKRIRTPLLERTRKELTKEIAWAKYRTT